MAAEITQIDTQDFTSQTYGGQDTNLLSSFDVNTSLTTGSYIEYFTYDNNQNLLSSNYNFTQYTIQNDGQSAGNGGNVNEIILDPEQILINEGFDQGEYITYFNFFNKQLGSELQQLYITEISSDRTEIRLDSTTLTNLDIVEQANKFIQEREASTYFLDFYLNFGDNQLAIANNIQLDDLDPNDPTILIKLYEALPDQYDVNSTLWVVTSVEESRAYKVTFEETPIIINDTVNIKGPNFNLDLKDQVNNSTIELSYIDLLTTSLTSSQNQLNSLLEEKEIDINLDYTNFNNFIHFSSAQTRLENFYYKIQLIEQYSSSIAVLNSTTNSSSSISSSAAVYESKIDNIITNFDGYEYYLYYETGSTTWPKTNTQKPYVLANSTSPTVLTWIGSSVETNAYYGGMLLSASIYDNDNINNLYFSIPEYLREDPTNDQYLLFINMVGQFYDNIWIYYKDVTQKYNADNRLEYGISKDIVADAIRDFGIKLYQNNFSNQDLYTAFLGITPEGGLFPFPNITGSLPTPSGFEYVDTLISASSDYLPLDDVNKSLYKRIYHNLPYLLKSKGTLPGLRALITSYGIPDTILRINEFGGKDKVNSNDWDLWQDEFNYAFDTKGNNYISSTWSMDPLWDSPDNVPSTLEFRFKTSDLPQNNIPLSQSVWNLSNTFISLRYEGTGYASSSYSGSIIDPYYQYAYLDFYPDKNAPTQTASVYLPFYNNDWWSVMVTRNNDDFKLCVGNKIYEGGENNTELGFYASSSISYDSSEWSDPDQDSVFGKPYTLFSNSYPNFSGSYQEIRYYSTPLSESVFKDYIMNPYSIEGNSLNSSPNELIFRASLGGELYTGSVSIHPKITGSWVTTQSFSSGDSNFNFYSTPTFIPNTEFFFADQPVAGIKNIIADKIRIENNVMPEGDTLSQYRALSQQANISQSYTPNINYLEVAFSPQNEINEDIMDQIGYFNIGEYIGDPRLRSSSAVTYPDLDRLRNEYFQKYTKNYDLTDFIRLIKFFDNSLFKMIKDFVPARTSLASGIVIKQHLLERNKYPQPQVSWEDLDISGTLKPTWNGYEPGTVEHFEGGTGGSFERFNLATNTLQSWTESINTISGSVLVIHSAQDEFYDGEFSGSNITVTTQILNPAYPVGTNSSVYKQVRYFAGTESGVTVNGYYNNQGIFENLYLNNVTSPKNGEILFFEEILGFSLAGPYRSPKYIKISKTDLNGDDNTIALGQLNNLLINTGLTNLNVTPPYPFEFSYLKHNVNVLNETSTYYLYEVTSTKFPNNTDVSYFLPQVQPITNNVLDYYISSSITSSTLLPTTASILNSWEITSGNLPHYGTPYFNTSSGLYTTENTPNTQLIITASIVTSGSTAGTGFFGILYRNPGENFNIFNSVITSFSTNTTSTSLITSSFYFLEGSQFYFFTSTLTVNDCYLKSGNLLITQSRAVSASSGQSIIEPYITIPNFYNSDENALINDVADIRQSTLLQDVDYSSGITTPVNFAAIISGSAIKATVPDSNYTTKRHIIPRYLGSRSTSQQLNTWSPPNTIPGYQDIGTYGKLPTIESLKTYVAYAPSIGGWPPERMNASAVFVTYLIDQNGDVNIPNTSENSLANIQQSFQAGERVKISTTTQGGGDSSEYRTIIRGGTRIEPVLYTQIGHSPASWNNVTMSFTTDFIESSAVANYTAKASPSVSSPTFGDGSYSGIDFNTVVSIGSGASWASNAYKVNQGVIDENVTLQVKVHIEPVLKSGVYAAQIHYAIARLIRYRGGTETILDEIVQSINVGPYPGNVTPNNISFSNIDFNYSIQPQNLQPNDEIYISAGHFTSTLGPVSPGIQYSSNSYFQVSQIPSPTNVQVTSSGANSLWGYPNNTKLYAITASNQTLNEFYNQGFRQVDISGSGFNNISLQWSLEKGDEFRFEGNENNTFVVKKIYGVGETDNERVSQIGSIEVQFGEILPSSSINLDHFLIRRYVDDASQILIEGFRPNNTTGPYIVSPEYVTPALNKNVDSFIVDLTQKGLL
jgi:hypothetical protein